MAKYLLILFLALPILSFAQDRDVSGVVKDATGSPMPGVSVVVKGTTSGTTTDGDGVYKIKMGSGTLVFSFIGYTTKEIVVENQSIVDVVLEESAIGLEEIVVVGYGSQKKKDISSAIAVVGEKELKDRPLVSAVEGLQGKVAGVQITQPSGKPGGEIVVRVRGATSVSASSEPLYVVDGIPMTDIRGLNPQDIASFSILKDAASAAIYGLRGANGVVLITTKTGKANQPVLEFGAFGGFSKLRKTIKTLNTADYRDLMTEIHIPLDPSWTNYTDWNKEVFGTGYMQNYQLSFSGGNENSHFMASTNYLKSDGVVAPAKFERYSVRLNMDTKLKPWLKIGGNINVLRSKTMDTPDNASSGRGGVIMSTLNTPPFLSVYKSDGSGQFDPNPFQPSWENPKAYMYGADQQTTDNRLIAGFTAEATILKGLTFKPSFAIDANSHQWDYYQDWFRTNNGRNTHGNGSADKSIFTTWTNENTLTYITKVGKNNFTLMAGTGLVRHRKDQSFMSGYDFPEDLRVKTMNAANVISNASTYVDEWSLASFFGRVMYDYDGKYLFTASLRRDGSSKLFQKWTTIPSFSAGWRISSESFMEGIDVIDDLKLILSWGKVGNQDGLPGNYLAYGLTTYTRDTPSSPLNGPTVSQSTIGNPDLTWELTNQTNIGLDISVLKARITLRADAYIKKTNNLILDVDLPSSVGEVSNIITNGGKIENKGLEFTLSTVNFERDVNWSTDFNISFNRNKVVDLTYTPTAYFGPIYSNNTNVSIFTVGQPLGLFYGYVADGVDPDTGDMIYRDINKNGYWDPGDRTFIGNPNPKFTFGITNTVEYKRFELTVFFQGTYGNDIFNSTRIDLEGMFDSKNQSTAVLKRWTTENRNTKIPRAVGGGDVYNVQNSTRFVEDGSYLRLKALTLRYNVNPDVLSKVGVKKLGIYVSGQNLLTLTKYKGFDPEVNAFGGSPVAQGIDYGTYPQSLTMTMGLNVQF
ncbi:MAG: TonB-dependent receptor [Cyclobacteriaceae bacterium]